MAYFEPSIDADGIHIPTYDDVLENLITEYKNIFGEDVYLGVETPDYQLLSMFAKHLDDMYAICVDAYNARNPDYATGNSLDLLLPLNGMSRKHHRGRRSDHSCRKQGNRRRRLYLGYRRGSDDP